MTKHTSSPALLHRTAGALLAAALLGSAASALAADVVLAIGRQPETLDPYNTNTTMTTAVTKSFYEGLFQFDKDLNIRNVLAESHEVSADGLVYTFKLRAGVKFHDGTDFNAEAVKVNLDRVLDPANKLLRLKQFDRIKSVDVINPLTVRITLTQPFSPFIHTLAHASAAMISPTALKKMGKDIAFHPVGTGPFEFVEWKQTEAIRGKKFAGYWKKGYPKIDNIHWKPVLENSTRAAMLQTGEADFAFPLPYEQASQLEKSGKVRVQSSPSIIARFLSFNMLQKPFDDLRVRQAIGYAINKEALVKVAFNGHASVAEGFVPQGVEYAVQTGAVPYNPQKARELLAQAGFPNGFESVLWSGYADSTSQKVIQFIQQQLQQVGIKLKVQALEAGQRAEMVDSWQDPKTAKVRLYYIGWSSSMGTADWALRPLFVTDSWAPKLANYSFYSNKVVDDAVANALLTTSTTELASLYKTAQEQLARDLPRIPLVTEKNLSGYSQRLSGVYVMPDSSIHSDEIAVK